MHKWMLGFGLAAIIATPVVASAQSALGVRAGVRWAELEGGQDAGSISSLVLGGYFGFGISNKVAIQLEAVYGTRGAEALRVGADTLDTGSDPSLLEMTYLEFPVLLRAGFPGERFLPSFFIGPYAGFLLGCDLQPAAQETRACDTQDAAQRFNPRGTDFGLVVGGGLDMAMGESTLFIDARYTVGLLSVAEDQEMWDARHRGVAVSGGVAVPVGR